MNEMYIARSTAIAFRMLGCEAIIMSAVDSTLFSLNEVASTIWRAADGQTPLSKIVDQKVCSEFEVSYDQAYVDAIELANDLARCGILEISDEPILHADSASDEAA